MMKEGVLRKNQQGRYSLEDGYYWTCGDYMELYIATQHMEGLEVTEEIKQLIEKCLDGEISFDIARKIVIDKIKGGS